MRFPQQPLQTLNPSRLSKADLTVLHPSFRILDMSSRHLGHRSRHLAPYLPPLSHLIAVVEKSDFSLVRCFTGFFIHPLVDVLPLFSPDRSL